MYVIFVRRRIKSLNSQFADKGLFSFNVGFEYILCYSKTNQYLMPALRMKKEKIPTKGRWDVFWSNADRPTMRYEILGFTPTTGQWRNSKEKADVAVRNYQLYQEKFSDKYSLEEYAETTGITDFIRRIPNGIGKNGGVQHWIAPNATSLRTSNWTDLEVSQIGKEFDLPFDNPKSKLLMMEIIKMTQEKKPIILDFFAGSGTTLHATMQLNAEDGGHRQCILVTNNENGICENVTYERNKRVIEGYTTPKGEYVEGLHKNNLRYYKTDFVPREPNNRNKRALVAAATDLLCVKNDVYQEQTSFGGRKLKPTAARYFDDGKTQMLIIYNELAVDAFVKVIDGMEVAGRIKVYVFSNNRYAYNDNFEPVAEKVEVCALPAAIYDAYKQVLKPRRRNNMTSADTPFAEETLIETEQGTLNFKEEGGEA